MAPLKDITYRGELSKRSVLAHTLGPRTSDLLTLLELTLYRSIDDSDSRMGFMRLSARGRALFGDQRISA